jgi:hypothetical protein
MTSEHFMIGLIFVSLFFAGTLIVSPATFARTLEVRSIFMQQPGDNATAFNGTSQILEGTDEEIASQYYKLGEEFDKKTGIKPGDPVTFIFRNNSNVTIPYTGEYKNPASDYILRDILNSNATVPALDDTIRSIVHPLGEPGDTICWIVGPDIQTHFVCSGLP